MFVSSLIISASAASLLVALLHVYVIVKGPAAYRSFGAGERLASMAERGSWIPGLVTSGITFTFLVFAYYYLAAGGWLPAPPFIRKGLITIAGVYVLRGAAVLPLWLIGKQLNRFEWISSIVAFFIGNLHVAAVYSLLHFGA